MAREIAHLSLGDGIASIAFSPNGQLLAASTINAETAVVWEAATSREVTRFKEAGGYGLVAFSPDGRYLAAAPPIGGGTVLIWNPLTGAEAHRLTGAGAILAFSPNGKLLATTGIEANARIWNVATGEAIAQLPHGAGLTAGVFTPDGSGLLTASGDGAARAWEPLTGRETSRMQRDSPLLSIAVSPDGKYLATGDEAGVVHTWFLRPVDLIAEACTRLTRDEWSQLIAWFEADG